MEGCKTAATNSVESTQNTAVKESSLFWLYFLKEWRKLSYTYPLKQHMGIQIEFLLLLIECAGRWLFGCEWFLQIIVSFMFVLDGLLIENDICNNGQSTQKYVQ